VTNGVKLIVKLIADDNFIAHQGPYIRAGEHMIAPNIQSVIYDRREKFDHVAQIKGLVNYIGANLPKYDLNFGVAHLIPYESVIGVPSPYYATRYYPDRKLLTFSVIINACANLGETDRPSLLGFSYILCGQLAQSEIKEPREVLSESLPHLNDVLLAYTLTRHDHNVRTLTLEELPSFLEYYNFTIRPTPAIGEAKSIQLHSHDVMDVWAKRLPDSKAELDRFVEYCKQLPLSPELRYLLGVMNSSIVSFCLGHLEDTVLDSDRFAELSLRLLFTIIIPPTTHDVSKLWTLYSTKYPNKAVINIIATELNLTGHSTIGEWHNKSHKVRNKLTHGLKFNEITRLKAQQALKYNLALVKLVVDHMPNPNWATKLLTLGYDTYFELFERNIGPIK
jgi:hypothetical protein